MSHGTTQCPFPLVLSFTTLARCLAIRLFPPMSLLNLFGSRPQGRRVPWGPPRYFPFAMCYPAILPACLGASSTFCSLFALFNFIQGKALVMMSCLNHCFHVIPWDWSTCHTFLAHLGTQKMLNLHATFPSY